MVRASESRQTNNAYEHQPRKTLFCNMTLTFFLDSYRFIALAVVVLGSSLEQLDLRLQLSDLHLVGATRLLQLSAQLGDLIAHLANER